MIDVFACVNDQAVSEKKTSSIKRKKADRGGKKPSCYVIKREGEVVKKVWLDRFDDSAVQVRKRRKEEIDHENVDLSGLSEKEIRKLLGKRYYDKRAELVRYLYRCYNLRKEVLLRCKIKTLWKYKCLVDYRDLKRVKESL